MEGPIAEEAGGDEWTQMAHTLAARKWDGSGAPSSPPVTLFQQEHVGLRAAVHTRVGLRAVVHVWGSGQPCTPALGPAASVPASGWPFVSGPRSSPSHGQSPGLGRPTRAQGQPGGRGHEGEAPLPPVPPRLQLLLVGRHQLREPRKRDELGSSGNLEAHQ